ncbi:hypothetical protein [Pseudoalteromonas sp.]|uniref:hypothetical protein n=1 Tax=Pseudoalteromonas sp. TaxID=53249 RepID=UPI00272AD0F4|nr:hypothetical protein [Pseudoalteromonas sp.]
MKKPSTKVMPTLELKQLASLVKFLEVSHTFAIDSSVFTEQEGADICQGYLSLRDQLDEFKHYD